jgi:WD40 repeat protein
VSNRCSAVCGASLHTWTATSDPRIAVDQSRSLLATHADGAVVVADVMQRLAIATLDGPKSAVRVARFDARSRVLGASLDGAARVWEAASPYRRFASMPVGYACNVGMGSRPDQRFIAVGCRDLPTRVWDTSQDRLLAELPNSTALEADGLISAAPAVSSAGDLAAIPRGAAVAVYPCARRSLRALAAHFGSRVQLGRRIGLVQAPVHLELPVL